METRKFYSQTHNGSEDDEEDEDHYQANNDDEILIESNGNDNTTTATPSQNSQNVDLEEQNPVFTVRRRRNIHSNSDAFESLDYEVCENILERNERATFSYNLRNFERFKLKKDFARWCVFIQIGILTALLACTINICIEELSDLKYTFVTDSVAESILKGDLLIPYLYWVGMSVVPVLIGSALVAFVEPVATGSGIAEIKCYLNGIKMPRLVRIKTLFVKSVGVVTSVVGGLAGGKEGPMIHSGAVIASGISQGKSTTFSKDLKYFRYFRDDHEKRDFVLGGAAAGVSAAFGAPIGGLLFSLEEAASFWNQKLIWRTLIASTISAFTLNLVLSAYNGQYNFTYYGLFNLGKFEQITFEYFELPIFMLMGISGGLVGALWISINTQINNFRKKYIRVKVGKVFEAALVAALGVTVAAIMIYTINDCRVQPVTPTKHSVKMFCEDNEYNAVAELWFQTPEKTVKSLLHDKPDSHKILTLAVFTLVYFFLSCITFGLSVSLGIFIPTVLVGAAWGRLVAMTLYFFFPEANFLNPGKYALIGAAAHMGGVLRMTISLTVILIEATGVDTTFTFPLILTIIIAKWIGDYFNHGIYDTQIKKNHVPLLHWDPPKNHQSKCATEIMNSPVVCFKMRESASYIYNQLKDCNHNGFPIVQDVLGDKRGHGRICGMILRSQLIVIFLNSYYEERRTNWENDVTIHKFRDMYPRYPSIDTVRLSPDKFDYTINFDLFLNPSITTCNELDSVSKIFGIFRALGIRHMVVVDKKNRVKGIITRKDFLNQSL